VTGLAVSSTIGEQNFKFTNNPGKGSGSDGIAPQCNGNDYQFRTDIDAAQDFVLPHLNFTPN
jgi:hypothetical protein